MLDALKPLVIGGKEYLPLIEGGKGISVTGGLGSGAWAAAGGVGTFSAVNADAFDENGKQIPLLYKGTTRRERHDELVAHGIKAGISQARIAHERSNGQGQINVNVLWEMGGAEQILQGVLEGAKGLIHGVTCGAGMPYKLSEIAAKYQVYYYPIVSSARAFSALWKRSFHKVVEWLGGVVYEDPWLAGGHNGLSNSENPQQPEDPYPRVKALRTLMNEMGLSQIPIIMAGGVWYLRDWAKWLNNPEIGPIAFQFGSRPLLTQESPISDVWKRKLMTLQKGDIYLNRFSPTGFYSSAVRNDFIVELTEREQRQVEYSPKEDTEKGHIAPFPVGPRQRNVYMAPEDVQKAESWTNQGYIEALKTPSSTLVFVTPEKGREIHTDQVNCMGCLSQCRFSNWAQTEEGSNGHKADPRSFCIQKTLMSIAHQGSVDHNLMFAGHGAYRFAEDPFYANGFIPTVKQLVDRIATGD